MKKKLTKFLCLAACVMLAAAMLALGASAAGKTVYLSGDGDDAHDGASYRTTVKTFARAYALLGDEGGRIVVCGTVNTGAEYTMPASKGTVTITATDGKMTFPLGKIVFGTTLTLGGDTILDRVTLSTSTGVLACGGHNVIFGKGLKTVGSIILVGGYNVIEGATVAEASIARDYTITVNGGDFAYFRVGNRRVTGKAPFGNISGNATFIVNGGNFTARDDTANQSAAAGMNEQTGNVSVTINGGRIYGNLFAVGRAGTNETEQNAPKVTGNITVTVNGGQIGGRRLDENQDNTLGFTGKYTLRLNDGLFPRIESIKGGSTASVSISTALSTDRAAVASTYKNPLRVGADPWVIYRDGYYYMVCTSSRGFYCYRSSTLDGLAYANGVPIWTPPATVTAANKMYSKDFWSPELHYVEADEFGEEYAGWWLYFAADDGNNENHRLFCVRALTDDPLGAYGSPVTGEVGVPVKMVVDNDTTWAIGQTLLRANGKTYLMWTSETGRGTANFRQNNSIALLKNPYEVASETTIFNVSDYDWEKHGYAYNAATGAAYPMVVEGATAVYGDNGEIIVTYTGSGYWTSYYALGKLVLKAGADPLDKNSWIKSAKPMFTRQNGIHGPGHAAFTTDAAGNRFMIYHAYLDWKKEQRYVFIQSYTLSGTEFDMNGGPYAADTVLGIYNAQPSIASRVSGFSK